MVQRRVGVLLFELGLVVSGAALVLACGTETGPVTSKSSGESDAVAPADEPELGPVEQHDSATGAEPGATDAGGSGGGGSGGGDSGSGGSGGGTADGEVITASASSDAGGSHGSECTEDPRCAEVKSGCEGDVLFRCEYNPASGCTEAVEEDCAPGTCGDGECQLPGGESCNDPRVIGTSHVLHGEDFAADFRSDLELNQHTECLYADTGSADAVLSVELDANDELVIEQKGELQAVFALLKACSGEAAACLDSVYGGNGAALTYTAPEAQTVLVVVDAYQVTPAAPAYDIWLNVNPECGNGSIEALEDCDDGNTTAEDGCSPVCEVEFLWTCSGTPLSVCEPLPSLGPLAPGDPTLTISDDEPFDTSEHLYYSITFDERVLLDLEARSLAGNTGDVDVDFYAAWDDPVFTGNREGNEADVDIPFEPGRYLVHILAKADLPGGFEVQLTAKSPGFCGDYQVSPFEECDNGAVEGCESCTPDFGWACDFDAPSNCTEVAQWLTAFGEPFLLPDPIPGTNWIRWMLEVPVDVALTGTIKSNEDPTGYYVNAYWYFFVDDVVLTQEDGEEVRDFVNYDGTLPIWTVPAGRYMLELLTPTGLPFGYTMTLEATQL